MKTPSTSPPRRYHFLLGALLILALVPLAVSDANACHRDNRPHGQHQNCGSGVVPGALAIETAFSSEHVWSEPREGGPQAWSCSPGTPFSFDAGLYNCQAPTGPWFHLDTHEMSLETRNRSMGLCNLFEAYGHNPPAMTVDMLTIGWTDDCLLDNRCGYGVRLVFRDRADDPWVTELTQGQSDWFEVLFSGTLDTGGDPDPRDSNPFATERDIPVTMFTIDFMRPGRDQVLAHCVWGIPIEEDVVLSVTPVVVP